MPDSLAAEFERRILDNRMMALPASWSNEIIFPYYDGLSIRNLAHTVVRLFEGKPSGARLGQSPLDARLWEAYWGPTKRVVLFISDGLGWRLLQEIMAQDAETAQIVADLTGDGTLTPITSVAPSTTATALPCIWTGAGAAGTGMVGTQVFFRELGMLIDLLHYRPLVGKHRPDVLEDWGLDFSTLMPATTVGDYLHAKRIPTTIVIQQNLFGTGLSRLMHRGVQHIARHYGYTDLWITVRDVLRATRGMRCFVNIYWGAVDGVSHLAGTVSESAISEVRRQLTDLRDTLAADGVADGHTLFLFTADHGHTPVPDYVNLADIPAIKEAQRCGMGGEGRFAYLYLRHDFRQQVIETLEKDLKDSVTWIHPGEALSAGLFGPDTPHPETAARLGDLSLIVREGFHIGDRPLRPGASLSRHGGFSEREMLVPLLVRAL